MVLCWLWCVDGVVLMVLCWWCGVAGVLLLVCCWWWWVDGDVLMVLCRWWCVDGVVLMVMCWWCCVGGDVLMVLCRWCCVDGVVLMVLCWWWCVDGVLLMVMCWWCCVGVVLMVCWWCYVADVAEEAAGGGRGGGGGGGMQQEKRKEPTWQCGELKDDMRLRWRFPPRTASQGPFLRHTCNDVHTWVWLKMGLKMGCTLQLWPSKSSGDSDSSSMLGSLFHKDLWSVASSQCGQMQINETVQQQQHCCPLAFEKKTWSHHQIKFNRNRKTWNTCEWNSGCCSLHCRICQKTWIPAGPFSTLHRPKLGPLELCNSRSCRVANRNFPRDMNFCQMWNQ